jgi:hypothetical protein
MSMFLQPWTVNAGPIVRSWNEARPVACVVQRGHHHQDEVLRAFAEVFAAKSGIKGKELLPENQIAQNFFDLAGAATVSSLASIEETPGHLVKQKMIPTDICSILCTMAL